MLTKHGMFARALILLLSGLAFQARADAPDAVGQWQSIAPLPYFPVHTSLLPTGKVLLWPGDGVTGNNPRLWDPVDQSLSMPTLPGYDIFCAGHTFLADGSLFLAGGHIQNNEGLPRASKYNPLTNAWTLLPDMNAGRWYPTTTTLGNGDILTVGGQIDTIVGGNPLPQVFQAGAGTWRDLTTAMLSVDQYPRMMLAPNGKVFYSSPTAVTRYLDTAGTGQWSYVATRPSGYRDYGSAVMYEPGKVIVMGGGDPPTNIAEVIDLNVPAPTWRTVAPMHFARRQNNATLLPDGKVLVTGGTGGPGQNDPTPSNSVYAAEMWDPATETWTIMASATVQRIYHSAATLLPDGRLLSTGGNGYTEAEIYSPPYLFKGPRPTIGHAPESLTYGQTFFVETPDAADISMVTVLRLPSVTHAFNESGYLSKLTFERSGDGLTVTAPPTGNVAPPGPYLLFLINQAGVPSVGKNIAITTGTHVDLAPPAVTISAPSNNAVVSGSDVTVSAVATDDVAVASVAFQLDGLTFYTDSTKPYAVSWNTVTAANADHILTAVAQDASGKSTVSTPVTVHVGNLDSVPPVVTLTKPQAGVSVTGSAVEIAAEATDNLSVSSVQFKVDGVNVGAAVTTPPYSISWNSITVTNGPHTITAFARDVAGNPATSAARTVNVTNNTTSCPLMPLDLSTAYADSGYAYVIEQLFGTPADDDNDGTRSTLRLFENNVELSPAHRLHAEIRSFGHGRFSHYGNSAGTYQMLVFSASDNSNPKTNGRNYAYCVPGAPVDQTPPSVAITSPLLGATVSGRQISVTANANDGVGVQSVQFRLDGVDLGSPDTTEPYAIAWDTTTAINGAHTLTAMAVDAAGNMAISAPTEIVVANLISICSKAPLNISDADPDGGFSYVLYGPLGTPGDTSDTPARSRLKVFEDDTALGPGRAPHNAIRTLGQGRYSHWSSASGDSLRISASDNSDPRTNGRTYSYCIPGGGEGGDATPPAVILSTPNDNAVVGGPAVTVAATASDDVGVAGVQFKVDTLDIEAEDVTPPFTVTLNTTLLGNGLHVLTALARDAAGNRTLSAEININVINAADGIAPTVTITGPADGATLAGSAISITANAADNQAVSGVQFKLDGVNLGLEDISAPYEVAWNTTAVANGPHVLTAVARDIAGNSSTSTPVAVTVTNQADGCVLRPVNVASAYSDGGEAYIVEQRFNTPADSSAFPTRSSLRVFESDTALPLPHALHSSIRNQGQGRYSHFVNADGTYETLRFSTTDNTDPRTNGRTYSYCIPTGDPDPIPPVVAVTSPTTNSNVAGTAVVLAATATDNRAVTGVQFRVDANNVGGEALTAPYMLIWDSTAVANGQHTLTAVARDAAGNATEAAAVVINVQNTTDLTLPVVAIASPAVGNIVSGSATLAVADAADNIAVAGVQFQVDGVNIGIEDVTPPFSVFWNTNAAANGVHVLTAVARDLAGNSTTSMPVDVTVQNVPNACVALPLNAGAAVDDGDSAYLMAMHFGTPADTSTEPSRSLLRVFENNAALGPAHAVHSAIRSLGAGRFSHWINPNNNYETLRFSTSDNSDPRTNGRSYTYCVDTPAVR